MKKTLAVVLGLLLVLGMVMAADYQIYSVRASISGTTTTMTNYKFAASDNDTSQTFDCRGATSVALGIYVADSASILVYYLPSWDGATFGKRIYIDSMNSAATTGPNVKFFALPEAGLAAPFVKFNWAISAYDEGVTKDTLSMKVYMRR